MSNTAPTILDEFNAEFGTVEPDVAREPDSTKDGKPAVPPKPEAKFRREIDLGDGSGVQVFEGETAEVLIDKLTEAQRNATIKIRQQTHLLKRPVKPAVKPEPTRPAVAPLSPDEEFQIGQQFGTAPSRYFERLFEATVGMKPSELHTDLAETRARNKDIAETMVGQEFVVDHFEDYVPTPRNYRTIKSFLTDEGLEFTKENLDYAFQELSTSGLLEKPQASKPAEPSDGPRIEKKPVTQKPLTSGLSGRESTPVKEEPAEVNVEEATRHAYSIPLAQLEREIRSRTTRR